MTNSSHAIFLSYASQDAHAAQRICETLRAAGIEVWFDQSELRGGDAWDQRIRREIRDCALFVAIISANTVARHEGYFRLEWDLADQRTHMIARNRAFILPVSVDSTSETSTDTPESFQRVQWTRLPKGETPAAFVERVQGLLSSAITISPASTHALQGTSQPQATSWAKRTLLSAATAVIVGAVAYFAISELRIPRRAFAPPPHSIVVLPFVNMGGDKDQEYFSDGLSEELLNDLARINDLQVAARTSAFSFKNKNIDINTIAHQLNVGAVLEGSVRRSGNTIRVTAQLIDAVTGFHLWSEAYDRELGDVLKLQTEIATAVVETLKVKLLGNVAEKVELGGTSNPAAFDAYLRGIEPDRKEEFPAAVAAYTDAIQQDPHYARAFARRSVTLTNLGNVSANAAERRGIYDRAQADARRAISLAPDLADGYESLGFYFWNASLDLAQATAAYELALSRDPGKALLLASYGGVMRSMGHADTAIATVRRAVALDPLNAYVHHGLGNTLYFTRRYKEAIAAYQDELTLSSKLPETFGDRGLAYYAAGDLTNARTSCEVKRDFWSSQLCLAVTYEKMGRHADAEAMRSRLQAAQGDSAAYQFAEIYSQWENKPKALEWLETALQLRDPGLIDIKVDPLLDPLRQEPRFQTVMRDLKFPD